MKSKGNDDPEENEVVGGGGPLVDLDDEELMEVMEQFALMSEEERVEAVAEVMAALDGEDPEIVEAMRVVLEAVKSLDESSESIMSTKAEDINVAIATDVALEMLSTSDWELINNKRGNILESLVVAGKISAEDAALFRGDDALWEKELRSIWDGLQYQAKEGRFEYINPTDEL